MLWVGALSVPKSHSDFLPNASEAYAVEEDPSR